MIFIKVTPQIDSNILFTVGLIQRKRFQPIAATIAESVDCIFDDVNFLENVLELYESIKQRRLQ